MRCARFAFRQFLAEYPELQRVSELQFHERAYEQGSRRPLSLCRGCLRVCIGRVKGDQEACVAVGSQCRARSFRRSSAPLTSNLFEPYICFSRARKSGRLRPPDFSGGKSRAITRLRRVISISSPASSKLSTAGNLYRRSRRVALFM